MKVMSNEGVAFVQFGDGKRVPPLFYRGKRITLEGKEIECDRIRQIKPTELGQPDVNDMPVHKCHKKMYPREWAEYEANGRNLPAGTPLEKWPALDLDLRLQIQQHGLNTVEQIADHQEIMGSILGSQGLMINAQAREFLKTISDLERLQQQDAEVADMREELRALREQMTQLIASVPEQPRGRMSKAERERLLDSSQRSE